MAKWVRNNNEITICHCSVCFSMRCHCTLLAGRIERAISWNRVSCIVLCVYAEMPTMMARMIKATNNATLALATQLALRFDEHT
jgi:hypothetical protein